MNWKQFLELAEMLAGTPEHGETKRRPQQAYLRKANSAACYAMFHAAANSSADALIGATVAKMVDFSYRLTSAILEDAV